MKKPTFDFFMHYRAHHGESIEERHEVFARNMLKLPAPLGWKGLHIPPAPDCGEDLGASFDINYPIPGLDLDGRYIYRGDTYIYEDEAFYDDKVWITFKPHNPHLNYAEMLHEHLPMAMMAFGGYLGIGYLGGHFLHYLRLHQAEVDSLKSQKGVNINGRNNIFTLNVVQYWDEELCRKALGYGRDEVIKRLHGKVPRVQPLMDGAYVVFNDDPDITFEEFCAYNDQLKPVLGLA